MCSYQALSRYEDNCSRNYRARNLDDIRVTQREALTRARIQLKRLQVLQHRPSLVEALFYNDDHDDETNWHQSTNGFDEPDCGGNNTAADDNQWLACSGSWSDSEDSIVSDDSSRDSYAESTISLNDLPLSLIQKYADDTTQHLNTRQRRTKARNMRHESLYKQKPGSSPQTQATSLKPQNDSTQIKQEFNNLMNSLKRCPTNLTRNLNELISSYWRILLNAIQDPDTGTSAIELLHDLCSRNLLAPETLVSLLQHGLLYSLNNALYALQDGLSKTCDLLITIISSEPAIVPYLIEVMSSSKLSTELGDRISVGSGEEADKILKFYHLLTEINLSHVENPLPPHIPQVLLATGVSQRTLHSYGPWSTMQKYFTPDLMKSLLTRCSILAYSEASDMKSPFELLAIVLKLACSSSCSEQWTLQTLRCLRDLDIVARMKSIMKNLRRSAKRDIESGDQLSANQALNSAQVCAQFLQFYELYFNYLAQGYAMQLMACESATTAAPTEAW